MQPQKCIIEIQTPTNKDSNMVIYEDQHPWSKYHKGTVGGYCFHMEGEVVLSVSYESYCGHGGGGTVWSLGKPLEWICRAITNATFTNPTDRATMLNILQNLENSS